MKRAIVAVLMLPLCGCYSDQAKDNGRCEFESLKFSDGHYQNDEAKLREIKETLFVWDCMESRGYRQTHNKYCPQIPNDDDPILSNSMNSRRPECYVPIGWGARQTYYFEQWVRSWT